MNDCSVERVGHYRIVSLLGQGGMGAVHRARDERLDREVALKLLPCEARGDETARARLLREARTASSLNHPHIAHVYEVGDDGDHVFLAMELVEGRTLQDSIPPGGFPAEPLLRHAVQVADALAYAHERGVIHRDLKSTNIMITNEGQAKVLDFGLAKRTGEPGVDLPRLDPALTVSGMVVGTPNHLAPEVLRGEKADARSDVWAFGIVLYEMASGRFPFQGATILDLANAIVGETPKPLSTRIPVGVQAVIARCLRKEPSERYRDGGEVRAALEALLGVAERRRQRTSGRRRWIAAAAAVALLLAGAWALAPGRFLPAPAGTAAEPERRAFRSLAVLPLANLSGDPAQEYFADGMTEELITNLAPIPSLKVISRTSVMRFKGSKLPLTEIAKALGVDAVVEGSVQRVGDRVRITAQLIEASTDRHLWAKSFDRDFAEILTLQTEVARDIARQVQHELTPGTTARLAAARPVNPGAYDLYLKGRFEWGKLTEAGIAKATEHFEQALAIDPGDARASSGLADSYLIRVHVLGSLSQKEGMPKVREYASRALAADPASAEARASYSAALFFGEWDIRGAEAEARKAIELNPGYAPGHLMYSVVLASQTRLGEAIEQDRLALELDPMSVLVHWNAINTLRVAHRYDEALAMARRGLATNPGAVFFQSAILHVLEQKGDYEGAIAVLEKHLPATEGGGTAAARLRQAYQSGGPAVYWRARMAHALRSHQHSPENCIMLACYHARLGEKEKALEYLEKAYEERASDLLFMRTEPSFASLKDDPRFQRIVLGVGFPDAISEPTSRSSLAPPRPGAGAPSRG